jgi:uncharacterized protein (TIGR03083 family)
VIEDAALQPAVAAEFRALAGALVRVPPADWETPSLCTGWRIREVVAHVTTAARYSEDVYMAMGREHGFDFQALSDELAAQDAQLPITELVACLRSDTLQRWAVPTGGYRGSLNHVVVHGLDATVALGLGHVGPPENVQLVLDLMTSGGMHENFGVEIDGRRFEAIDLDWSYGSGSVLRGTAADILLAMCRRDVGDRLAGDPL